MGVSLRPSDAVAGGGQFDDVDVRIKQCRFRLWDYNGTIPNPILGLAVKFEGEGYEFEQVYSAGETKHFVPSTDGRQAVPVGQQTGLGESTNAMALIASIVNSGFPEDKIGDDIGVFEGLEGHVNKVPQVVRKGLQGDTKDKTVLVFTKISKLPWDAPKKTAAMPKTKSIPTPVGPIAVQQANPVPTAQEAKAGNGQAAGDDLMGLCVGTVLEILGEKGGTISKAAISNEAFKKLQKHPQRNAAVQTIFKDEFLKGAMGEVPFVYDGTTISIG